MPSGLRSKRNVASMKRDLEKAYLFKLVVGIMGSSEIELQDGD